MTEPMRTPLIRHVLKPEGGQPLRWDEVPLTRYKQEGEAPFLNVTRQVLFDEVGGGSQWRYFEVAPGGHTTLERHRHTHAVMIVRGRGRCLLGQSIEPVDEFDLIHVPPATWHQFRADGDAPLGFLCLVDQQRDRPELPDARALAALREDPAVAGFIRTSEGRA